MSQNVKEIRVKFVVWVTWDVGLRAGGRSVPGDSFSLSLSLPIRPRPRPNVIQYGDNEVTQREAFHSLPISKPHQGGKGDIPSPGPLLSIDTDGSSTLTSI